MEYLIRDMRKDEYPLLNDFLYNAIFIPDGVEPPPESIIKNAELQVYVHDFGVKSDDHAIIAEVDGKIIGAVWTRIMHDYGHIDDDTPSLAISLYKQYRGNGIGKQLMKSMLNLLKRKGYARVSLSVQKANYAVKLYKRVGFTVIDENDEEYIMVCDLKTLAA